LTAGALRAAELPAFRLAGP